MIPAIGRVASEVKEISDFGFRISDLQARGYDRVLGPRCPRLGALRKFLTCVSSSFRLADQPGGPDTEWWRALKDPPTVVGYVVSKGPSNLG